MLPASLNKMHSFDESLYVNARHVPPLVLHSVAQPASSSTSSSLAIFAALLFLESTTSAKLKSGPSGHSLTLTNNVVVVVDTVVVDTVVDVPVADAVVNGQ